METISAFPRNLSVLSHLNSSVLSRLPQFTFQLNQSTIHFPKNDKLYQHLVPIKTTVADFFDTLTVPQLVALLLATSWLFLSLSRTRPKVTNAVYHGYRSWLEPTFLVQARYIISARKIITSGYRKVL